MANGRLVAWFVFAAACLGACESLPPGVQARAVDGDRWLTTPVPDAAAAAQLEADLAVAREAWRATPHDRDAAIWVARRLGYLGRYREAIDVLTETLEDHPGDPFVLRHRGHRWITLREFGAAISDLEQAADACRTVLDVVEPDGRPTPGRPPHSSLHYNVHYHLGLAHFLDGDFESAERAWLCCLAVADDDESRVAVTHWLWSVRMRLGDPAGAAAVVAPIRQRMDVVENVAYHQLCLFYGLRLERTALAPRSGSSGSALAFGLAHFDLVMGQTERAFAAMRELADGPNWSAFGAIAAEVELARH